MTLYNCRTAPDGAYHMTKFDDDMNIESDYDVSLGECACPAGARNTCRHRKMLPEFIASGHIDDEWFYNFETHGWLKLAGLDEEIEVIEITVPSEPAPPPTDSIRRRF